MTREPEKFPDHLTADAWDWDLDAYNASLVREPESQEWWFGLQGEHRTVGAHLSATQPGRGSVGTMTTRIEHDFGGAAEFTEEQGRCHVKHKCVGCGEITQCPNSPSWCLLRSRDGVHRLVCDAHKHSIYDELRPESVLIPYCGGHE